MGSTITCPIPQPVIKQELVLDVRNSRLYDATQNHYFTVDLPVKIKPGCIYFNNFTYLIGGNLPPYNNCYHINLIDFELTPIPDLIQGRFRHGLATMSNEIYAIGGISYEHLFSVEKYDGKSWKNVANLNNHRVDPSIAVYKTEIYVISGDLEHNTIEKYANDYWILIPIILPVGIRRIGLCVYDDGIIMTGGNFIGFRTNANYNRAWKLNCRTEVLESVQSMPVSECFDTLGTLDGDKASFIGQKNLCVYDLITDTWEIREIPLVCSHCFRADCHDTESNQDNPSDPEKCPLKMKFLFYRMFRMVKPNYKLL
jgi:Kelch motif